MIKKKSRRIGQLNCTVVQSDDLDTPPQAAVILCHGFGASGEDLVSLANEFIAGDSRLAEAIYVFPTAPLELDPMYDSRAWWMIDIERLQQLMEMGETREMRHTSPPDLPACRQMIFQIIDALKSEYSLASNQIVIGGFSQGAMLSTDVALHYPESLGGLIIWSGGLICESDWVAAAHRHSPLKIVQTHGRIDPILSIAGAEDLRQLLLAAKHDVRYAAFQGPHTIPMIGLQIAAQLVVEVVERDNNTA